jgi:hypothetical protein
MYALTMRCILLVALLFATISAARLSGRLESATSIPAAAEGAQAATLETTSTSHRRSLQQDVGAALLNQTFQLMDDAIASYSPCLGVDWELLWQDEFNDYSSAAVDPTKWTMQLGDGFQYGIPGWGNDELQYYTERSSNIYVQDGKLHIQAQRESGEALDWMYKKCLNDCEYWCTTEDDKKDDIPGCIQYCSVPRCENIMLNGTTSARIRTFGKMAVVPSEDYPSVRIEASVKVRRGYGLHFGCFLNKVLFGIALDVVFMGIGLPREKLIFLKVPTIWPTSKVRYSTEVKARYNSISVQGDLLL